MATSYLFAYYTLESQVSLSSCMSIKTSFFFLTFCCIITPISGLTVLWKIKKKLGEQYTPKIMNILRTESILGSNFTGSYKKKSVLKSSFL